MVDTNVVMTLSCEMNSPPLYKKSKSISKRNFFCKRACLYFSISVNKLTEYWTILQGICYAPKPEYGLIDCFMYHDFFWKFKNDEFRKYDKSLTFI